MDSAIFFENLLQMLDGFSQKLPDGALTTDFEKCDVASSELKNATLLLAKDLMKLVEEDSQPPVSQIDSNAVQITATKSQLDQRIASFQAHAQNAINQQNIQEFFPHESIPNAQNGCARTHAVYQRRPASKPHVQVSRVKNIEGPQTQVDSQGRWCSVKRERQPKPISCPDSIQERLNNLEDHIGMNKNTAPKDVYTRLKALEDKMLKLEAISPEYFHGVREQRNNHSNPSSNADKQMSLDQIDDRIKFLKRKLLSKN